MIGRAVDPEPARHRLATVRARLVLLGTAAVAGMLVVSAVALVAVQRRLLLAGIDETLVQRADNIEGFIAAPDRAGVLAEESDQEDSFLQLLKADGTVEAATPNLAGAAAVTSPLRPGSAQVRRTVDVSPIGNEGFRLLVRDVSSRGSGVETLVVGKNVDDLQESLRVLTISLSAMLPTIIILLGLMVWWVTGRALRPVEAIRGEVETIGSTALHRRVPEPGTGDEIDRLARTMNAMLDRLEHATEQQRRFVSDASHELRTPLTRLRAELEVGLDGFDGPQAEQYRRLLGDTTALEALVEDLLFLARSEAGSTSQPTQIVDLDDLVLAEARQIRERGTVLVDASAVAPARVLGAPNELTRVLHNLATNAERHAASTVYLESTEVDGTSRLVVADDGPGIPTEHRATIFERFTRLDDARAQDLGGSGLGLAIVREIVVRHHGTVAVSTAAAGGARFIVTLPRVE
jgi:signal transduction histidine kinase